MKLTSLSLFAVPVALLLLCLMAMQPFSLNNIPLTDDGTLHLYRVIALDYSLTYDNPIYPRYSSGLVYGYGAPLFNYYSPASYVLPRLLYAAGMSFVQAWLISMAIYIYVAASGAYLIGKLWTNRAGGFVTATTYVYAPYMLFDTVTRGTSAEVAGLALLPLVLYSFHRLAEYGRRGDFLLATLSYAAFILMHNVLTLHGTAFIGMYCLLLLWMTPHKKRAFSQMLLAGLLALLMTAFFWLPALMETDFVKINGVTENLDFIAIRNSLRPLTDVLAFPRTADPTQLQAPVPITIHWIALLLCILAVWFSRRDKKLRQCVLFLLVITGVLFFLNTESSAWLWENLPLLDYSQFAWRVLGIASLTMALLSGIAAMLILQQIRSKRAKIAFYGILLAALMTYSIPWLYTHYSAPEADSIVDLQNYERETQQLALSSYTEYLPATNQADLDHEKLRDAFAEKLPVARLSPHEGVDILSADWSGTAATLDLIADEDTTLIFDWLYVPGWQATLNDKTALAVKATQPEGFASIEIPAGEHQLQIRLGRTPTQQNAELASMAGILLLMGILFVGRRFWRVSSPDNPPEQNYHWLFYTVSIVTLSVFFFKMAVVDNTQNIFRRERFADGIAAGVENALNANFSDLITLYGFSAPDAIQAGSEGDIRLYMGLAGQEIDRDYSTLVTLRNSVGVSITEAGSFMPGGRATSQWLPETYLEDVINLQIPPATPPGTYTLDIALYDAETGQRLDVLNAVGNPEDVKIIAGNITITHGKTRISGQALSDDPIALFAPDNQNAVTGIPETAQVGDELEIIWTWTAQQSITQDFQAKILWLVDENQIAAMSPALALTPGFTTSQWQIGDIWTGTNRLFVPGALDAGDYMLAIQLMDASGNAARKLSTVQAMTVTTPERTYEKPEIGTETDLQWRSGIRLHGYELQGNQVDFVWSTGAQLDESLRLFVHVLDGEQIIAQSDGIPVNWSRPTPGWQPGEFILTNHDFADVSPGTYDLRIGWYDPLSGNRRVLDNGDDALFLPDALQILE